MKIGLFTDSYFPQVSGVSTSIELLRNQLIEQGHTVIIFTTTDPHATDDPTIIRLPSIPFASFEDRRIAYRGFDKCLLIAQTYDFDIIHTHTEFSLGLAGKYVASKLKIPTIHTYHTMYENYTHYIWNGLLIRRQHVKWYSRLFCSQATGVIAPSLLTRDTLQDYGVTTPIRVIPTGVKLPTFDPACRQAVRQSLNIPDDAIVLLSLSRLSKEKSIDEILEAYPAIYAENPDVHLVIVGDGPQRASLEAMARGYQLEHVHFVGEVEHNQVNRYYQMADLYINASESESQGLTYLEALANHLPIIAKKNDYLDTIINNPTYGTLYTSQQSLADCVNRYLAQRGSGKIRSMSDDDLHNISVEKFTDSVVAFYEEVLQEPVQSTTFFKYIAGAARELISKM